MRRDSECTGTGRGKNSFRKYGWGEFKIALGMWLLVNPALSNRELAARLEVTTAQVRAIRRRYGDDRLRESLARIV